MGGAVDTAVRRAKAQSRQYEASQRKENLRRTLGSRSGTPKRSSNAHECPDKHPNGHDRPSRCHGDVGGLTCPQSVLNARAARRARFPSRVQTTPPRSAPTGSAIAGRCASWNKQNGHSVSSSSTGSPQGTISWNCRCMNKLWTVFRRPVRTRSPLCQYCAPTLGTRSAPHVAGKAM